jgi:hypothetical protein
MKTAELTIAARRCLLRQAEKPRFLLLQLVDEQELSALEGEVEEIRRRTSVPFAHCAVEVLDWNAELSPWEAPGVFGKEAFGGGAPQTLALLEERILPEVRRTWALGDLPVILGGYSLAGLFALWSASVSGRFAGVAAASPSVWFPRWTDWASEHPSRAQCVYLSLGDREEKTRNKTMARVGECIRQQQGLLEEQGIPSVLEWNRGNHFTEPDLRTAKGFAWCLEQMGERASEAENSHREG